jgi:hypothetical protein
MPTQASISSKGIQPLIRSFQITALALLLLLGATSFAQDDDKDPEVGEQVHPMLDSTFMLKIGAFLPDKDIKLSAGGILPGPEIDFSETLHLNESENIGALYARWNFGKKWWFAFEYFESSSFNSLVLEEDLVWEGVIFEEGSFVEAGVGLDVTRLFIARKVVDGSKQELSVGLGFHWLDISAFIQGEAFAPGQDFGFQRGDVSVAGPLPNLGVTYMRSLSPRWALKARVDWLSVSLDKYRGRFWGITGGVDFAISEHFGLEAGYYYFDLDVSIRDTDWRGKADLVYEGPVISLTAQW